MRLQLNFNKPGNYAFFCPVSRVHLTLSNPVADVDQTTSYIERGLKSKVIIDVTNKEISGQKKEKVEKPSPKKEVTPSQKEESASVETAPKAEKEPVKEVKTEEKPVEAKPEAEDNREKVENKPKGKKGRPKKAKN